MEGGWRGSEGKALSRKRLEVCEQSLQLPEARGSPSTGRFLQFFNLHILAKIAILKQKLVN